MKKIYNIFISLLSFTTIVNAQNLSNVFNIISTNNDMMGGTLLVFCEDGIIENISIGKSDFSRNINSSPQLFNLTLFFPGNSTKLATSMQVGGYKPGKIKFNQAWFLFIVSSYF